jgi:hypothetical protein
MTCWLHNIPAIGLPGATNHALIKREHVDGFPEVLVALDSDKAGEDAVIPTARHLRAIGYEGRIRRMNPAPYKDLNAMHLALNGTFDDEWDRCATGATDVTIPVEPSTAAKGYRAGWKRRRRFEPLAASEN